MSQAAIAPTLPADVLEYFQARQGSFGALNLLPNHLPSEARVRLLVRNCITVDYAIGRAYRIPAYVDAVRRFASMSILNASKLGLESTERDFYSKHVEHLGCLDAATLADAAARAAAESLSSINIFVPRQCNLQCRSCYTAATSVEKVPFTDETVEGFYRGFKQLATQAKQLGATGIYTSGDGEPTIFPRFFDLLEFVQQEGLQWLFFTAGLSFSSEVNARRTWQVARRHLSASTRERVEASIDDATAQGIAKPVVTAFLQELTRHRDSIQVYHSLWSADATTNTTWRRPAVDDYDYRAVAVRDSTLHLPSSVLDLMTVVFPAEHRPRFGLEVPVSHVSVAGVAPLATFVVDKGIRSYFELPVATGRNRTMSLQEPPPDELDRLRPLLSRSNCSFRNIHQPTVKVSSAPESLSFYASPGMGIGAHDLEAAGTLESCQVSGEGSLFGALHAPLIAHANYGYVLGCKCDMFAQQSRSDGGALHEQWRKIAALIPAGQISLDGTVSRLREHSGAPSCSHRG